MNHPKGLREANEKLYALRFPEQIPQTLVTSDMRRLKEFMAELGGEMIIKPLDGGWRQRRVLPQPTRPQYQFDFGSSDRTMGKNLSWASAICRRFAKATNESSCLTASRWGRSCAFLWKKRLVAIFTSADSACEQK